MEFDYSLLNPGIRDTVKFFHDNGFETCDSGDGVTRQFECDPGYPYVVIKITDKNKFISECERAIEMLEIKGFEVNSPSPDESSPWIDCSYYPLKGYGFIYIANVVI